MDDVREIVVALEGQWHIGDKVRTIASAAQRVEVERNACGEYFFTPSSEREWWWGKIEDFDFNRPDFMLISHTYAPDIGMDFDAWYRPEDVEEGW